MAQDMTNGILAKLKNIFCKTEGYIKNYSENCDNHLIWMKDYLKEAEKVLSKETFKKKKQNEKDSTNRKKKSKKQVQSRKVSENESSFKKSIVESASDSAVLENELQYKKENQHQELENKMDCTFSVNQFSDSGRTQQSNKVPISVIGMSDVSTVLENEEVINNKISLNWVSKELKSMDSIICNISNGDEVNTAGTAYHISDNSCIEYIEESICENSSSELSNDNLNAHSNVSNEKLDLLKEPQFKPKDFENAGKNNVQKENVVTEILGNSIPNAIIGHSLTESKKSCNIKSVDIPVQKLIACNSDDENDKNISQFNYANDHKESPKEKKSKTSGMKSQMSEQNCFSVQDTPSQITDSNHIKAHIFLASAAKMSETRRRSSLMRYKIRKSRDYLRKSSFTRESNKNIDAVSEKNYSMEPKQTEIQTEQTETPNFEIVITDDSSFYETPKVVISNECNTPLFSSHNMKSSRVQEIVNNLEEKTTGKKLHQNQPFSFISNWKKNAEKSCFSPQVFRQRDGVQSCLQSKLGSKDFNSNSYLLHSAPLRNSRLNTSVKVSRYVSKLKCTPVGTVSSCKRTKDPQVQRISRPGSFNIVCNVSTFLKSHNAAQESEKEKNKLEEIKKRQQREEEILKKRTQLLQMKVEEQKRKREERMQKNLEARQQIERAKEERIRYLEQSKEEKLTQFGKELEKRREEIKNKNRNKKNKTGLQPYEAVEIATTQQSKMSSTCETVSCAKENVVPKTEISAKKISAQHENNSSEERKKLNSTFTKSDKVPASSESCQITPPDETTFCNYDISNLKSDDDSDNECAPSKPVPAWAIGIRLKEALIRQHYQPPNLDKLFGEIMLPDLSLMFGTKKKRFLHRTSSAVWHSPDRPFCSSFSAEYH